MKIILAAQTRKQKRLKCDGHKVSNNFFATFTQLLWLPNKANRSRTTKILPNNNENKYILGEDFDSYHVLVRVKLKYWNNTEIRYNTGDKQEQ